jgi:hypothetical protein
MKPNRLNRMAVLVNPAVFSSICGQICDEHLDEDLRRRAEKYR